MVLTPTPCTLPWIKSVAPDRLSTKPSTFEATDVTFPPGSYESLQVTPTTFWRTAAGGAKPRHAQSPRRLAQGDASPKDSA